MDALEALAKFKSAGNTKAVSRFPQVPGTKLKDEGQFVSGVFKSRRALPEGSLAGKSVIEIELDETNAKFSIKNGDSYDNVEVAKGTAVNVFAPKALDDYFQQVADGASVIIISKGKIKKTNKAGKVFSQYDFDLRVR